MAELVSRAVVAAGEGCYSAARAAALSGVPLSTVYHWARVGVVVPSVSPVREMLWSFADLMALRVVSWLRHPKTDCSGQAPASPMPGVRAALRELDRRGIDVWSGPPTVASPLVVDRAGDVFIRAGGSVTDVLGNPLLDGGVLDVLAPFSFGGGSGPDLLRPRDHLRIVPSRVAGEPHLVGSRITSLSISALVRRGMTVAAVAEMYEKDVVVVAEAVDLEDQLAPGALVAA